MPVGSQGNSENIFKPVKAEQITRIGPILRKTSLDVLPQIFNALKGEINCVNFGALVRADIEYIENQLPLLDSRYYGGQ